MFCPSCGAADQASSAYCRHCGQWLVDPKSAGSHSAKTPEQRMTIMAAFSAGSSLMAILSALALYVTYLGTPEAKWSIYVAGAFLTVIAVHQAVNFFFALGLKKSLKHRRGVKARDLKSGIATGQLSTEQLSAGPDHVLTAPSVVEDTTQLLETNPRAGVLRVPDRQ
jgi:hypothetical protein